MCETCGGHGPGHDHDHDHDHPHTHDHAHGHDHDHPHTHDDGHAHHTHTHTHGHCHTEEETKAVLNRLSRAIGHLESIKRMVQEDRDCSDVIIQLSAVRAAINGVGKLVLQNHIQNCIVDAVQQNDMERLDELNFAIDRFVK